MSWLRRWQDLWSRKGRRPPDTDLDEELRLHLELEIEKHLAAGVAPDEASRRAKRRLGNRTRVVERTRAVWRVVWWDDMRQDLHLASRLMAKQWQFSLLAISVLALGTGANTAVFSAANAVLFKPLPVEAPDRLVWVYRSGAGRMAYETYRDYREAATTVSELAGFGSLPLSVRLDGVLQRTQIGIVSGNYFVVLGIQPTRGRLIRPDDEGSDRSRRVAVVSHDFWQHRLDGDPAVVGRTIIINGEVFVITGVTPVGFRGVSVPIREDLWIPVLSSGASRSPVQVIGRLRTGVLPERAAAEFQTLADRFDNESSGPPRHSPITVVTADRPPPFIGGLVENFAFLLMAMVGLVLLVACFNLASLLLARSSTRTHEVGVRLALGAGRGRVVRQLLTESALLTVVGAIVGLGIALWVARWVSSLTLNLDLTGPFAITLALDASLDWRVLSYTAIIAVGCLLTFALVPALHATRTDVLPALRGAVGQAGERQRSRIRTVLITAQLAVSVLLLTVAGLLLQSWWNAATTEIGFDPESVLVARVDPGLRGHDADEARQFYGALAPRLAALPDAEAASITSLVPLSGTGRIAVLLKSDQADPPPGERLGPDQQEASGVRTHDQQDAGRRPQKQ